MEVEIKDVEPVGNPEHGKRYKILPVKAKMPGKVANSKEAAHFFQKRHTKVESGATKIGLAMWESKWKPIPKMPFTLSDRKSWSKRTDKSQAA